MNDKSFAAGQAIDSGAHSLRQQLKARTLRRHVATEALFGGQAGLLAPATYRLYLQAMAHVHGTLGRAAARVRADAQEAAHHDAALLALGADLQQPQASIDAPPLPQPLSQPLSQAQAWGVSYALLGSCIGAQVLLRGLEAAGETTAGQATTGQEMAGQETEREAVPKAYLTEAARFAKSGGLKRFFTALEVAAPDAVSATEGAHMVFDALSRIASQKGARAPASAHPASAPAIQHMELGEVVT